MSVLEADFSFKALAFNIVMVWSAHNVSIVNWEFIAMDKSSAMSIIVFAAHYHQWNYQTRKLPLEKDCME